jgi:hypothetical protein
MDFELLEMLLVREAPDLLLQFQDHPCSDLIRCCVHAYLGQRQLRWECSECTRCRAAQYSDVPVGCTVLLSCPVRKQVGFAGRQPAAIFSPCQLRERHAGGTPAARRQYASSTQAVREQYASGTRAVRKRYAGSTRAARGQHAGSTWTWRVLLLEPMGTLFDAWSINHYSTCHIKMATLHF